MGRDPNTPAWTQHLALEVGSMEELLAAKARLKPTVSRWWGRPTTRCSSRSISLIRAAIASNWPLTPTRRKWRRLDEVKWDMLNEWAKTKKAPQHARWMHDGSYKTGA
jgi:hypothetical protein